jgi:hypothetical protein
MGNGERFKEICPFYRVLQLAHNLSFIKCNFEGGVV